MSMNKKAKLSTTYLFTMSFLSAGMRGGDEDLSISMKNVWQVLVST